MKLDDPRPQPSTLPFDELERAYEALALALDAAGPGRESLLLTRLALVLAHRGGDLAAFEQALAVALDGLVEGSVDGSA